MKSQSVTPKPVVVTTICSECGLAWDAHGEKPTTSDCIRLLKAELAKRPTVQPYVYPTYPQYPYYIPNVVSYRIWYSGQTNAGGLYQNNQSINCVSNTATPAVATNTCTAVAA